MAPNELLRVLVPLLLSAAAAVFFDRQLDRRGLTPPGFILSPLRRAAAMALLATIFWLGIFSSLTTAAPTEADLAEASAPTLFLLHGLLLLVVVGWYGLGFTGLRSAAAPEAPEDPLESPPLRPLLGLEGRFARQFGLRSPEVAQEIGIGLVAGIGAWGIVLASLVVLSGVVKWLGGEAAVPQEPPALVPWIASLPVLVRLVLSLSAGVVEELFFRGFLQPRMGILGSTLLFVLAHASYQEPFMLLGIALLSVLYALLVRWRQSIWAAMSAHFLFDAVQLLVVIPWLLKPLEGVSG